MNHIYDVIILGAGPAGLSAGLYAGRSRLDTLIIEKGQAGGQIINTDEIENYPGQIVEGETGVSLVRRMYEQTEQFGAEHVRDTITNVELGGDIKVLTGEKDTYQAKNIIIATGAYARPIGCKGEQEYKGRGISYCATCDANFFTVARTLYIPEPFFAFKLYSMVERGYSMKMPVELDSTFLAR